MKPIFNELMLDFNLSGLIVILQCMYIYICMIFLVIWMLLLDFSLVSLIRFHQNYYLDNLLIQIERCRCYTQNIDSLEHAAWILVAMAGHGNIQLNGLEDTGKRVTNPMGFLYSFPYTPYTYINNADAGMSTHNCPKLGSVIFADATDHCYLKEPSSLVSRQWVSFHWYMMAHVQFVYHSVDSGTTSFPKTRPAPSSSMLITHCWDDPVD